MANLANRYRPSTWEDVTEQKLVVDMLKSMCDDPNFNTRNFLLIGPAGCGKANTLDTEILTPDGFIKMGDIQIGQSVFTHSGSIGKVSGVFPQGKRDIYRITLQDKTHIDVSDEHINVVYRYNEDKKQREDFQVTTSELIELFETTRFKLRIDTPSVDWEYSDVPIDPYLLGCLLGDGGLSNNFQFSGIEEDIIDSVDTILRRDWNCKLTPITSSDCDYDIVSCDELHYKYEFHFEGLRFNGCKKFQDFLVSKGYPKFDASTLIRLGISGNCKHVLKYHPELSNVSCVINPEYVSWNSGLAIKNELSILNLMNKRSDEKHIPKCYLYNSREVRLKLLQGLFDTDGTIDKSGSTEFTTSSKQLSDDFEFLVRSLGCRDTVSCSRSSYTDADGDKHSGRLQYYHYIKFPSDLQFYSSCKHKERFKIRQNEPIRNIVSIEYRGREECQCIMVDHPDHTYICGNGFIPTHNTTLARIMGNYVNEGKGEPIEIDAASNNGIDAVRNIIDQARSYPVGQNWKIFILDECFHKDTLISTTSGYKRICELKKGDVVHNMTGTANVKNVFKNSVPTNHLLLIHLNSGQDILTTSNHLFFTNDGWVEASNLVNGDELYDYSTMHNLRNYVSNSTLRHEENLLYRMCESVSKTEDGGVSFKLSETRIYKDVSYMWDDLLHSQKCEFSDVFNIVLREIESSTRTFNETEKFVCFAKTGLYLSDLWKTYEHTKERPQEILFERMCEYRSKPSETTAESCGLAILRYMWESICSEVQGSRNLQSTVCEQTDRAKTEGSKITRILNENETEQSYGESCDGSEDDSDERAKRYFASSACESWRKWSIYKASDCAEGGIGRLLDLRISSTDKSSEGQESDALSYQLQTRPCLSRFKDRNRGGWERPFYEISSVIRRKESHITPSVRVESIEVYKRGDNEQSFRSYFSCEELGEEFVDMYDVEVDGHPSYYANDILVHNCHAFSNQAWQALLKTLESGAGKTLFFMATTNPEKIPATILSRVQTFQLSKISLQGIHDRLCYVLESEKSKGQPITYTDDAVNFVAKMANGGMRDSLTLLDKCLAFSNDITIENVTQALNLPEYDDFFELLSAYAKKNNVKITEIVDRVYNSGVNFVKWFENFHSFVINIVKYIYLQDISKTMIPSTYQDKISKYGNPHLVVCLKLANKLMKMNHELKSTQYLQEVALTNLCFVPAPAKKG